MRFLRDPVLNIMRQKFCNLRADVLFTDIRFSDSCNQLIWSAFFADIASSSRLDDPHGVLVLRMHTEDEDGDLWIVPTELLERLEAVAAGHGDVEHDDI